MAPIFVFSMTEFNTTHLHGLIQQDYKYLVYEGGEDHAILTPLKNAASNSALALEGKYQIPIQTIRPLKWPKA